MRYVRPFETSDIAPGGAGPWLISADEGLGIAVRIRRGSDAAALVEGSGERFLQLINGEVSVSSSAGTFTAKAPEAVFIPVGVSAEATASSDSLWMEVAADVTEASLTAPVHIEIDQSKFIGTGFAYQPMIDRSEGAHSMRVNVLQVAPGSGSPDFHIHAFAQIYLIQEGEMTVDVGKARLKAPASSLVVLPAGCVHRNFNASNEVERHISLLVPEPQEGDIFDYAITIHEEEAEIMTALPADAI